MYERMLNGRARPTENDIYSFIGSKANKNMERIEKTLGKSLDLRRELRFPFGTTYGWGYKFSHKTKHLFFIFFEKNGITVTTRVSNPSTDRQKALLKKLSDNGKKYWKNKYPCPNGGWIHYRVLNASHLDDIGVLLSLRTNVDFEFSK